VTFCFVVRLVIAVFFVVFLLTACVASGFAVGFPFASAAHEVHPLA
jgi:hypothetical protein